MKNDELINSYFSNSLDDEAKKQFDKLLKTDSEFKAQFEFEQHVKRAVVEEQNQKLKQKLKSFEADVKSKSVPKKPIFNWRIAASIALFIGAGWFGYNSLFGLDYNKLFEDNYSAYPNTVFSIERDASEDSLERQAFLAYETENYDMAIKKFDALSSKPYSNFYKAQCYLKLSQFDKSKQLFNDILTANKEFVAESHWYLSLIALKLEDKQTAKIHLQTIADDYNYKKENAKDILEKL